jgi:hypothetical protein
MLRDIGQWPSLAGQLPASGVDVFLRRLVKLQDGVDSRTYGNAFAYDALCKTAKANGPVAPGSRLTGSYTRRSALAENVPRLVES